MVVSKGIVLALDLGTPSCSRGPLAFDLEPQLSQGALGFSKGALLTLDLENLDCSMGHCLLTWSPCLLHGAPLALDLGP